MGHSQNVEQNYSERMDDDNWNPFSFLSVFRLVRRNMFEEMQYAFRGKLSSSIITYAYNGKADEMSITYTYDQSSRPKVETATLMPWEAQLPSIPMTRGAIFVPRRLLPRMSLLRTTTLVTDLHQVRNKLKLLLRFSSMMCSAE